MVNDVCDALNYDPVSGVFTWKTTRFNGKVAGCLHKKLGYLVIGFRSKHYYAHRLAWRITNGYWPDFIDHINGDRADNRISNLREVPKQDNHRNMKCFSNSTTKVPGVSFHKQTSKWRAYITVDTKQRSLGCFDAFEDAVAARKQAEQTHGFHKNHGRQ